MLWKRNAGLEQLNQMSLDSMIDRLGIRFTALTADTLTADMPVDNRTRQPFGLLHGGASVTLAESLGSFASWLATEPGQSVVGTEINASHHRAVYQDTVIGCCHALHLGRSNHVWAVEIRDSKGRLCCTARLTTAVIG
ncbi:hotdog fold thioesterase [Biostraticola tofi]|uniref:1,4-dihydroxy-2-naphthoyl-CoA hydrolase n=1 Tax=Biostraticola tofi TaxID=466109 RepID=A0A4R3YQR4_9GAMM|nr:hotdog fold thioesterase [Biostraticola tofi]TCV95147.1 1,4-dihydroxy-2-naphthoyl-CoA hydrolase [Biostraticola tofi]